MPDTDVLVIGSGAGGLTAALALVRAGQSVHVLEQHYLPGGWCHTFGLGGYRFSPGVHYIGGLDEGGDLRQIYDGLGVSGDLTFLELNPAAYDQVRVGERTVGWAAGREQRRATLTEAFPDEARGVGAYLDAIEAMGRSLGAAQRVRGPADVARLLARSGSLLRWGARPLAHLLHHHVTDPVARAVLAAQVGDTGLPPSKMPAGLHAAVLQHYERGAWYPLGGGGSIPRAFIKGLKAAGGTIQMKASVERILTEPAPGGGHRAIGVRLADGTERTARHVISNADPQVTFGQLIDPGALSDRLLRKLGRTRWSITALSLFMAADLDPADHGLDSGNVWWMEGPDLEGAYRAGAGGDLHQIDHFPAAFLTVTSLKDRTKVKGRTHTLEAFVLLPYDPFGPWAGTQTGARPPAYHALKDHLQGAMIRTVAKIIPDIADRLRFVELGTPLTNDFYCRSTQGGLYGVEKTLGQLGPMGWLTTTEVGNLHLCGASTLAHGVAGATMTGLLAASQVMGCRPPELLGAQGGALTLLPADRPESWPDDLRRKAERATMARPPEPA
jgi:phytoene dehydrogenase-like protein